MEPLTLKQVARITSGRRVAGKPKVAVSGVSIDSRSVAADHLFVALEGERFDGHAFVEAAARAGAAAAVVSREVDVSLPQIVVDDTLAALAALGVHARSRAEGALVVGVTGTNGKTGTKDLTVAALGAGLRTVGSAASYNNAVGVPLTMLDAQPDTEALVVEIGTNAPGEIAELTRLVRPEVGVITNVHAGHLEGLGSVAGVRAEKGCLIDGLVGRRVSVLNRDDPSFSALCDVAPGEVVSFGLAAGADLRATDVVCSLTGTRFTLEGYGPVHVRHLGRHAVLNSLAALAAARVAGVDTADAVDALSRVPPPPGRLQIRAVGGLTVLDDSYNANPGSLAAAAAAVSEIGHPGRRVFIVGDMLELGEAAPELHRAAGRALAQCFPDLLVAVGRYAQEVTRGAREIGVDRGRCFDCADRACAEEVLSGLLEPGDLVLIKASRRMALDTLVSRLVASQPAVGRGGEAAVAP